MIKGALQLSLPPIPPQGRTCRRRGLRFYVLSEKTKQCEWSVLLKDTTSCPSQDLNPGRRTQSPAHWPHYSRLTPGWITNNDILIVGFHDTSRLVENSPSRSNGLMFSTNGWQSRSNGWMFLSNGWPKPFKRMQIFQNGWQTACERRAVNVRFPVEGHIFHYLIISFFSTSTVSKFTL